MKSLPSSFNSQQSESTGALTVSVVLLLAAALLMLLAPFAFAPSAFAQSTSSFAPTPSPGGGGGFQPTPVFQPQTPVFIPQFNPTFIPVRENLPLIPTDFLNPFLGTAPSPFTMPTLSPGNAVKKVDFPLLDGSCENLDGILVRAIDGTTYTRPSLASVNLDEGSILVSVRRPATMGLITTPHGSISVNAGADVIVRYQDGILRVMNLTGLGEAVKVKVSSSEVSATVNGQTFTNSLKIEPVSVALKVGHELLASDHPLCLAELKPHDGIGRRQYAFVESNKLAVSEFSLESAVNEHALLVDLQQKQSGAKERRVLNDLAKMASVLNYMQGSQGYVAFRENKN